MLVVVVAAPLIRKKRGKQVAEQQEFIVAGFALGSAFALLRVLFKVVTEEKLQTDLEWDGTVAICISSGLGIYLSLKEIIKLF